MAEILSSIPQKGLTYCQLAFVWPEESKLQELLNKHATFDPDDVRQRYYDPKKLRPVPSYRYVDFNQADYGAPENHAATKRASAATTLARDLKIDEIALSRSVNQLTSAFKTTSLRSLRMEKKRTIDESDEMTQVDQESPTKVRKVGPDEEKTYVISPADARGVTYNEDSKQSWRDESVGVTGGPMTVKVVKSYFSHVPEKWKPMIMVLMPRYGIFNLSKRRDLFEQHRVHIRRFGDVMELKLGSLHQQKMFELSRTDGRRCTIGEIDESTGTAMLAPSCSCGFVHVRQGVFNGKRSNQKDCLCQCATGRYYRHQGMSVADKNMRVNVTVFGAHCRPDVHTLRNLILGNTKVILQPEQLAVKEAALFGQTMLEIAIQVSNIDAIEQLVKAGATVRYRNFMGKTLLEVAVDNVNREMKYILAMVAEGDLAAQPNDGDSIGVMMPLFMRAFEEAPFLPFCANKELDVFQQIWTQWVSKQDGVSLRAKRIISRAEGAEAHAGFVNELDFERGF